MIFFLRAGLAALMIGLSFLPAGNAKSLADAAECERKARQDLEMCADRCSPSSSECPENCGRRLEDTLQDCRDGVRNDY